MASPNLSEIITTTLRNRSGELADNVSKGNALLNRLKAKGAWKTASGRTIVQELDYAENGTFMYYSGGEVLDVSASDVLSAAEFNWKQAVCAVTATGLEIDVQNTGKEAIIDLFDARIRNAQRTMKNNITNGMYSDGTGTSGKQIGGLQLLVANDPTTGTVGGINRASYSFWQNQTYDASSDGGTAATASNIQTYMNSLYLLCSRGTDRPDLITADSAYYALFWGSLQANQRFTDPKMAEAGFTTVKFAGADVVYEDNSGHPSNTMYFLSRSIH